MSSNGITLPPIIITPDPPLPKPPGPLPGGGVIAKPLRWDGKIPKNSEIDAFFSKKGITHYSHTMSVLVTVATVQRKIEQSYTAYLPRLARDLDADIVVAVGPKPLSAFEKAKTEKSIVERLITQNTAELAKNNKAASAFFGRNVLAVELKKSAVDFVNIFQNPRNPSTPLQIYKSWEASARAAYTAKILKETIRVLTKKSTVLTQQVASAQTAANKAAAEAAAKAAAEKAAADAVADKAAYKDAVSFLADTNEEILKKYGANMSKIAQDLQSDISGKKIRNYKEAMTTFEKVRTNPKIKLNAKDTRAVVSSLNALDKATFADNVNRLGKAFGVVGKIVKAETIREKAVLGFETGEWKPLMLELESMAVGTLAATTAGAMAAVVLAFLGTPALIAVPAVALLMATVSSYLDASKADEINNFILKQ